jgi:phosphoenolpyruvate synthase/pyruvate phosphate dikinase
MKKIPWIKLVSRRHTIFRIDLLDRGTVIKVKEFWGLDYDDQMFVSDSRQNTWFCNKEKIDRFGKFILKKVNNEQDFVDKIATATEKVCIKLVKITKEITSGKLNQATDKQLAFKLKKFVQSHNEFCIYFDVSNSIKEIGTRKIKNDLMKLLKKKRREELINDYIEKLIEPEKKPLTNLEQIQLREIAQKNKKNQIDETILKKHAKKYEWLSVYNPDEPPLSFNYFQDRIKDLLSRKQENTTKNKLLPSLTIPIKLQYLIKLMKKYVYLHTFRAEMLSKSYYLLKPLLTEIAIRWKIDLTTICALTPEEIITSLEKGSPPNLEEADKRKINYLHLIKGGVINIYSGKKAEEIFIEEIGKKKAEIKEKLIKGLVASQGLAEGRVRIILNKKEINQMQNGEILVTTMSSPDYVFASKKSGAIVTDEGGLLCHAAIISREIGKPCVVGTKIATQVLKTGDWVKVDAYQGIITRKENL